MTSLIWLLAGVMAQAAPPAVQTTPIAPTMRWFYDDAKRNFVEAAEAMPAGLYEFRPTPDVRSFGEIVGHIANWQFTNCARARGVPNPNAEDLEKTTGKAALVAAIKDAYAFCDPLFESLSDERLSTRLASGPASFPAMSAIAHPYLHYGNLVTYMRLKGIVPPSTARRSQ